MNKVILHTEYFPPVLTFSMMEKSGSVYIEHWENFQKKSSRNRCSISSPNGIIRLSVPLQSGKNQQCPIQEVMISYEQNWIADHMQALLSSYGKSPYYEYYIDDIAAILHQKHTHLFLLNQALTDYFIQKLGIDKDVYGTDTFTKIYSDSIDLRYLKSKVKEEYISQLKPYPQVWDDRFPFQPNLSILDLIFSHGPESPWYL